MKDLKGKHIEKGKCTIYIRNRVGIVWVKQIKKHLLESMDNKKTKHFN